MLNLDKYSPENLGRIRTIIKIVLDELELQEINHFSGNKIPLIKFEREGFSYPEVKTILNKIAKEENNLFKITNEEIKRKVENSVPFYIFDGDIRDNERQSYRKELLVHLRITEADLRNNIILRLSKDTAISRLKTILASIKSNSVKQVTSTSSDFCRLENNTFFIKLLDGSEKAITFDTKRKTNYLRILFEILFEHWKHHGTDPLPKSEIAKKLREELPSIDIYSNSIKDIVSSIRKTKIRLQFLSAYIKIIYDSDTDGYILDIRKPS